MLTRRTFLRGLATSSAFAVLPSLSFGQISPKPLFMPPLLDATQSGRFLLEAQQGQTSFLGKSSTGTWGFNQSYLGPTLRLATGQSTAAEVLNMLKEEISVHWHGLMVPGEVDGGPHQTIAPGTVWTPELSLTQPTAMAWYHSHVHTATARQVHFGLTGVLHVSDGRDDERGLPSFYGVDDLTLVIQDRLFDRQGRINYSLSMHDQMMGFIGDTIMVNGQVGATAIVPRGLVRLRLLNGSNARIYTLAMSDGRPLHLIATDDGLLDRSTPLSSLQISPGERYEILADFSDGLDVTLTSGPNRNMGMMGGGRREDAHFAVLPFAVDQSLQARITQVPIDLGGSRPDIDATSATRRRISLDMQMGMGMMMRRSDSRFSINGAAFDMGTINFDIRRGTVERWTVSADVMMHPFHVHGVSFQVLSENGRAPLPQNSGWKDTVLINGWAELLIRFDQGASPQTPFMYHCHILEHEDGGMMGQFTVT